MALEFRILGALEVLRDGEPLRLAGRLRRSLVTLLVLHAGEAISADRLIEELWPGHDDGRPRAPAGVRLAVAQGVRRRRRGARDAAGRLRAHGGAGCGRRAAIRATRRGRPRSVGCRRAGARSRDAGRGAGALAWAGPRGVRLRARLRRPRRRGWTSCGCRRSRTGSRQSWRSDGMPTCSASSSGSSASTRCASACAAS